MKTNINKLRINEEITKTEKQRMERLTKRESNEAKKKMRLEKKIKQMRRIERKKKEEPLE